MSEEFKQNFIKQPANFLFKKTPKNQAPSLSKL